MIEPGAGSREPGAGSREPGAGSREPGAGSRVILAVARTLTSTVRLLDALEVVRSDARVRVLFTVDGRSRFSDGTMDLLQAVGARVVPRERLASTAVDLVLTASENADPGPTGAPVVILPHGVGFHKYLRETPGNAPRLSGVPLSFASDGRLVVVVTDRRQQAQLGAYAPGALGRSVVVRDLFHQRLLASRRLRNRYRHALGVRGSRKLVVVSSTWGQESLFARWQGLPARLLRELPADEYAVAVVLHPNTWAEHGPWQVRSWLGEARDAGLIVVPATGGWQAALVSADAVIGDHGSVTFYAASLGLPVIVASFGTEVARGTAMDTLGRLAPALDWAGGLRMQVEAAISSHQRDQYATVTGSAFAVGDESARSLREVVYGLLGLAEPRSPAAVRAWPVPEIHTPAVTSFVVHTCSQADGTVLVSRYPAAVDDAVAGTGEPDTPGGAVTVRHLAAYDDERDVGRWQSASSVVYRGIIAESDAVAWISRHRTEHMVVAAATEAGVLVGSGQGPLLVGTLTADDGWPDGTPEAGWGPMIVAAVVYHLLWQAPSGTTQAADIPDETRVEVCLGQRRATVTLRRRRSA